MGGEGEQTLSPSLLPPTLLLTVVTTMIQVALEDELINRVRFAYKQQFEDWRATSYMGKGGVEQQPFLLEDKELVVEVTTFASEPDSSLTAFMLCGMELLTSSGRSKFWGSKSKRCKKSVTKDTFLAFCSGGMEGDKLDASKFPFLTFHWGQNKPTSCA